MLTNRVINGVCALLVGTSSVSCTVSEPMTTVTRQAELAQSVGIAAYRVEDRGDGMYEFGLAGDGGELGRVFAASDPAGHDLTLTLPDGSERQLVATVLDHERARFEIQGPEGQFFASELGGRTRDPLPEWFQTDRGTQLLVATFADYDAWAAPTDDDGQSPRAWFPFLPGLAIPWLIWCISRCDLCTSSCNAGNCNQNACNDCNSGYCLATVL